MKNITAFLYGICLLLMTSGLASAALTTIGTANYDGSDYNLIWDDNNNGNSIVWLDYSNAPMNWDSQVGWAAGLDSALTNIKTPGYIIYWGTNSSWRLPATVDGEWSDGYDGTTLAGYNITTSEIGHLFYEELNNLGFKDTSGNYPQTGWGLNNTGEFINLITPWYWSDTELASYEGYAWSFRMFEGKQFALLKNDDVAYGLAVRSGQVSAVPVPGAIWLLGSGLIGLVAMKRRKK